MFQELDAHLPVGDIQYLGYPHVADRLQRSDGRQGGIAPSHGAEKVRNDVSDYYLAGEIRTHKGIHIAIEAEE